MCDGYMLRRGDFDPRFADLPDNQELSRVVEFYSTTDEEILDGVDFYGALSQE